MNLKTVKLASCRYLDTLAHRRKQLRPGLPRPRFRGRGPGVDPQPRHRAQFGGKYFCHDVRVIRLPRHGASLPIGIGVSCSADRQILGKITPTASFSKSWKANPAQFLPDLDETTLGGEVVNVDLARPMDEIRRTLSQYPIRTRLSLWAR